MIFSGYASARLGETPLKSVGAANSKTRTPEQTAVAIFWTTTTSTPWNTVARAAAKAHNNSLAENARLFAVLNMITSDSQVACWCCKYKYNFLRPITAIHNADRPGNSAIKSDSNWELRGIVPIFCPLASTRPNPPTPKTHQDLPRAPIIAHVIGILAEFESPTKFQTVSVIDTECPISSTGNIPFTVLAKSNRLPGVHSAL
jgi:hypothetical protein